MNKTYLIVKLKNGKLLKKEVPNDYYWKAPLYAIILTLISMTVFVTMPLKYSLLIFGFLIVVKSFIK